MMWCLSKNSRTQHYQCKVLYRKDYAMHLPLALLLILALATSLWGAPPATLINLRVMPLP